MVGLRSVWQVLRLALLDDAEDNVAVAADALVPVISELASDPGCRELFRDIRDELTRRLAQMEDLSPAGGAIMTTLTRMFRALLGGSVAKPEEVRGRADGELGSLVATTVRFTLHPLTSVRRAAFECLKQTLQLTPGARRAISS